MNKIIIFAILTILFQQTFATRTNIFDIKSNYTEDPHFFENFYYLIEYVFFWAFLFEISLIIVLHFKQNQFYVSEHSSINFMVILGQLLNNFFQLKSNKWDFESGFFYREAILLFFLLIQLTIGFFLNKKLISTQLVKGIFILRYLHRMLGYLIYLSAKVQIAIYAFYFFKEGLMGYMFIGLLYGLVLITHFVVYYILRNYDFSSTDEQMTFLIRNSENKQEYAEILKNIENGDIEEMLDDISVNEAFQLSDAQSVNTQLTKKTKIDWVLIEDRVFDITGLRHPKGNYILKSIKYRDVTREMHGLKAFRFENRQIHYVKTSKHQHVNRTFRFLRNHCIGEILLSQLLMNRNEKRISVLETNSNIDLFEQNTTDYHEKRVKKINEWLLGPTFEFDNTKDRILFFEKSDNEVIINLSSYWNLNYGKYFLVKLSDGKCLSYFVTLAVSPKYMSVRESWYKQLNLLFFNKLEIKKSKNFYDLMDMNSILEGLKSTSNNALLKTDNDLKDYFLPLFSFNENRLSWSSLKKVSINGPLGFGLGFNHKSTHSILILVKDEGILPFTDMLEFFSQKTLIEYTDQQVPHPIFGKEYLLDFASGMTINFYWEVTPDFRNLATLFGISSLEIMDLVAEESSKLKEDSRPRTLSLFKSATIISNFKKESRTLLNYQFEAGFDYPSMKKIAFRGNEGIVEKLVISGNQKFVESALKKTDLALKHITIL